MLQQFPTKIPDVNVIALRLENQDRFNRDRAQEVAAAFRSSLSDYGLINSNGNLLPVRDEADSKPAGDDAADDELAATSGSKAPNVPALPGTFRIEVPLAGGRKAVLALPEDVTATDTTKICAVPNAYATS